jgi:hypothetical protein
MAYLVSFFREYTMGSRIKRSINKPFAQMNKVTKMIKFSSADVSNMTFDTHFTVFALDAEKAYIPHPQFPA